MTKAERIRRTAKRTKPDAVEQLRDMLRWSLARVERYACDAMSDDDEEGYLAGRRDGAGMAYAIIASRLKELIGKLTEEAT